MSSSHSSSMLTFARTLAARGGECALGHFGKVKAEFKADESVVTEADREVERTLSDLIRKRFPNHSIIGEEGTSDVADPRGPLWIIDPIDGTSAFAQGLPVWAVSVGYFEDGLPVAGAVLLPVVNDLYTATHDGPPMLNDQPFPPIAPKPVHSESLLLISSDFHKIARNWFPGKVRAMGSLAAHICYVARSTAVAVVNQYAHVWDVAAAGLILNRAGGVLRYVDGQPVDYGKLVRERDMMDYMMAGHPELLPQVRKHIEFFDRGK